MAAKQLQPIYHILSDQLADQEYLFGTVSIVDYAFAPWLPHLDLSNGQAWRRGGLG